MQNDILFNLSQYAEKKEIDMRKIVISGSEKFYKEAYERFYESLNKTDDLIMDFLKRNFYIINKRR